MSDRFSDYAFVTADGSEPQTYPDRLAERYNVRDFGAVGNGTDDDWSSIMAAYNHDNILLVTTASNVTASFTGSITNGVLTTSGMGGTLSVNDIIAYTGDLPVFLVVLTVNGGGSYNLTFNGVTTATGITRGSQSMFGVGRTLTFANVPGQLTDLSYYSNHARNVNDLTTPGSLYLNGDLGAPRINTSVPATSTTVTLSFVVGVVAAGSTIEFTLANKGTIVFPPGEYLISEPIDVGAIRFTQSYFVFEGTTGETIIRGNFVEYLIKRGLPDSQGSFGGGHLFQGLTLINEAAGGGGIRIGAALSGAIRDCDITADYCINEGNYDDDVLAGGHGWGASLEYSIKDCLLRPYHARRTGSTGIAKAANGLVANVTFTDFDIAARTYGQEGCAVFVGCRFFNNNVGLANNTSPVAAVGGGGVGGGTHALGCHFKDNGIAIAYNAGSSRFAGLVIEGTEGATPEPQYGFYIPVGGGMSLSEFMGVSITGQFEQAGIYMVGGEGHRHLGLFAGVFVENTSTLGGVNWKSEVGDEKPPSTAMSVELDCCNLAPVYTVAGLPAKVMAIASSSWSGGVATINFASGHGLTNEFPNPGASIVVTGVTPSGYNVVDPLAVVVDGDTIQYSIADPGSPTGSGGSCFMIGTEQFGGQNAFEGQDYNVNDSSVATWTGAIAGGGSSHVKVRINAATVTVIGK
jgi:hypothetical protein